MHQRETKISSKSSIRNIMSHKLHLAQVGSTDYKAFWRSKTGIQGEYYINFLQWKYILHIVRGCRGIAIAMERSMTVCVRRQLSSPFRPSKVCGMESQTLYQFLLLPTTRTYTWDKSVIPKPKVILNHTIIEITLL